MNATAAFALALAPLALQDEPVSTPAATEVRAAPEPNLSPREIAAVLAELAVALPELVRLESIGRSSGGEELWLVTVAKRAEGPAPERPALLFVAGLAESDFAATEVALALIRELASDPASAGEVAGVLERATLFVVPCVNPDLRARVLANRVGESIEGPAAPRSRVDFDHNFPAAWDPNARAGSGGYPLCEPETRALAEFLLAHPEIAVVAAGGGPFASFAPESAGEPDAAAHRAFAAGGPFTGVPDLGDTGGTLLRFAYAETGAFAFANALAAGGAGLGADRLLERCAANAPATVALLGALARVEFGAAAVEALGEGTWKVDLALANRGALPTASRLARARGLVQPPRLAVSGARVLAAAARRADDARGYEPIAVGAGGAVELAEIGAGATLELRLVVAAERGAVLDLAFRAPRASGSTARIELR